MEIKNIKDNIGKTIFGCSQTTEIALLFTDWPLTTCFWARISTETLTSFGAARIWTLLHEALNWICRKYAPTNDNTSFCRVFVVFSTKSSGKLIHEKPFGSKNVFKSPPWIWNKIKFTQFTQWINGWLSKDYRILAKPEGFPYFPICRIRQDKPELRRATPSTTFQKCH